MKTWLKSKTVWFNLASLAVALSGVGLRYDGQLELDATQAMAASMLFTALQTLGNIYLRSITSTAIK